MSAALPGSYRWALVTAAVLGFHVAFFAGIEAVEAINYDVPPPLGDLSFPAALGLSPVVQSRLMRAALSGYQSALASMVPWRAITSILLAVASALVFVMTLRLRVLPEGRAQASLLLGRAALATAVLRSIDGAQALVLTRARAELMGKAMVLEGLPEAQISSQVGTALSSLGSVGWTLAMVAAFVTLGNYFRSETLRSALERAEPS